MLKKGRKIAAGMLALILSFGELTGVCDMHMSVNAAASGYGVASPRVKVQVREVIEFGNYWQEDTNGDGTADQNDEMTPLRWQVLKKEGDDLFLISDKIIAVDKYSEYTAEYNAGSVIWENCRIRKWLNGSFYSAAFTGNEQAAIKTTTLLTDGAETEDKLFLLSKDEVTDTEYGFNGDPGIYDQSRRAVATDYTVSSTNLPVMGEWWLRNRNLKDEKYPGKIEDYVYRSGVIVSWGDLMLTANTGIRPALHLDLKDETAAAAYAGRSIEHVSLVSSEYDTLEFGTYNGKKMLWRVLSVDGDDAFLLSEELLIQKAYNTKGVPSPNDKGWPQVNYSCTWSESTLREWLNGELYSEAFTDEERQAVNSVKTEDDAEDNIFVLSVGEATNLKYGFPDAQACTTGTRVAFFADGSHGYWWLRDVESDGYSGFAALVSCDRGKEDAVDPNDGLVNAGDWFVQRTTREYTTENRYEPIGVRPALHLDLSSSVWTKGKSISFVDRTGVASMSLEELEEANKKVSPTAVPTQIPVITPTDIPTATPVPTPTDIPTPSAMPTDTPATDTPVPTSVPSSGEDPSDASGNTPEDGGRTPQPSGTVPQSTGSGKGEVTPTPVPEISYTGDQLSVIRLEISGLKGKGTRNMTVGDSVVLKAKATAKDGSDAPVNWIAPDGHVTDTEALADGSLKLTTKGPGTAIVTAVSGTKTKSVKLKVKAHANTAKAPSDVIELKTDEKYRISVTPDGPVTDRYFFESTDPEVCSVDGKGVVKAKAAGSAEIKIYAGEKKNDRKQVDAVRINVTDGDVPEIGVKEVSVNYRGNKTLYVGEMGSISAVINKGLNNGGLPVRYSFDKKGIVKIDSYGRVTAKKAGKVKITAECGGISDSIELTVEQPLKLYKVNSSCRKANVKKGKAPGTVSFTVKTAPAVNRLKATSGTMVKVKWSIITPGTGVRILSDISGKAVFEVPYGAKDTLVAAEVRDPVTGITYKTYCVIDIFFS